MDEPWIASSARHRTHRAIQDRAACAATGLRTLGIGADAAVALLLRNDFAMFEAALAARRVGAFTVPINWHAGADDVAYILRDCGAKLLVAHADLLAGLGPAARGDLPIVAVETPAEIRAAYAVAEEGASPPRDARIWDAWCDGFVPFDDPADGPGTPIIYTSGTTGRPKGVKRAGGKGSSGSAKALAVYGFDKPGRIRALINGPMYHSVPNAYARLALEAGADIVLQPRFDPEELLALIARHGISHMHIVPAMMLRLLRLPEQVRARYDVGSLRHVVHGAAPCPHEVKHAMLDWFGPVIHEYYGSTETGLLTLLGPEDARNKPGSVGRPLPGIKLHILGADGTPVPTGTSGDIYAGSDTLHAFTYVGGDAKRAAVGRGDLVTAGDVGWLDADGHLHLRDRKRDIIQVDKHEIAPAEIEAAVLRLDGIRDCAVFGREGDGTVYVCVEPVDGTNVAEAAIAGAARDAVGMPDLPLHIALIDALPREDSGKIFKARLRAQMAGATR